MKLDELMAEIRRRPDDDDLRLVFADALEEAGETKRAQYIRAALRGEKGLTGIPGPTLAKFDAHYRYERGLVSSCSAKTSVIVEHAAELLSAAPTQRIGLWNEGWDEANEEDTGPDATPEMGARLGGVPELGQLIAFDSFPECATPEFLEALLFSPHLTALDTLVFEFYEERDLAELAMNAPLPALTGVCFRCYAGDGGDDVAQTLLRRPLERIELSGLSITDDGVATIANAHSPTLEWLEFGTGIEAHTSLSADGLTELARTRSPLKRLELTGVVFSQDAILPLLDAKFALNALSLQENELYDLDPLWNAPCLATLEHLNLRHNSVHHPGVRALVAAPFAPNLRSLDLAYSFAVAEMDSIHTLMNSNLRRDIELNVGKGLVYADDALVARFRERFPSYKVD